MERPIRNFKELDLSEDAKLAGGLLRDLNAYINDIRRQKRTAGLEYRKIEEKIENPGAFETVFHLMMRVTKLHEKKDLLGVKWAAAEAVYGAAEALAKSQHPAPWVVHAQMLVDVSRKIEDVDKGLLLPPDGARSRFHRALEDVVYSAADGEDFISLLDEVVESSYGD